LTPLSLTEQYRALLEVSESISIHRDLDALFHDLAQTLHRVVRFDFLTLILYDPGRGAMRLHILESTEPSPVGAGMETAVGDGPSGLVWQTQQSYIVADLAGETRYPKVVEIMRANGVQSSCLLPLTTAHRRLGAMGFGSKEKAAYSEDALPFLSLVAAQVAVAVDNALAYNEIAQLKEKLAKEKLYLEDEIRTEYDFEEMIGESPAWKRVLREVETVAPTDSSVLIRGESGTGKELIARAIHNLSRRQAHTFVKLNCAAIPTGLLESELFGH
jgi:formate hydrogenlyase transcriptional activator